MIVESVESGLGGGDSGISKVSMKSAEVQRIKRRIEELRKMGKCLKSATNQVELLEEGAAKCTKHPVRLLLGGLGGRSGSGGDSGPGGSGDEELRVAVSLVGIGAEVAAFCEELLAVDGEHGVIRHPKWEVCARGPFGTLRKSNKKWNMITGGAESIWKTPGKSTRGKNVESSAKGPVDVDPV